MLMKYTLWVFFLLLNKTVILQQFRLLNSLDFALQSRQDRNYAMPL